MKSKIVRWGNSLAIRLPRVFADKVGLAEGTIVEIDATSGEITVRKPRYALEDLVSRITPENRHSETDWGGPAGKEAW